MNPETILTVAKILNTLIQVGPTVIQTVEDAYPFAKRLVETIGGKEPTAEELAQLEAEITNLHTQIQLPLKPEED